MEEAEFKRLEESARQAKAILKGELQPGRIRIVEAPTLARSAREKLGMTQEEFARALQTSPSTIRSWEQGKRNPTPATRLLLKVATQHPREVLDCVQ